MDHAQYLGLEKKEVVLLLNSKIESIERSIMNKEQKSRPLQNLTT